MDACRKTKILCTIGPASSSEETLRAMVASGMNAARLNFSHGTHASQKSVFESLRRVESATGCHLAIVQDLQGPRIRLGSLGGSNVVLSEGQSIVLSSEKSFDAVEGVLPVDYPGLENDVRAGESVLINDGRVRLKVLDSASGGLRCEVVAGGPVSDRKGINLPDTAISIPTVTQKDLEDLQFGLDLGVDAIAVSFVRRPSDLRTVSEMIGKAGRRVMLIAKIEKAEAIEHFKEILAVVDGIMIARGDLGIEVPFERVPVHQKNLIEACSLAGKTVITATQMLESMMDSAVPTRAEAADVANAVFDGTDCLMLSGETAAGKYPVESVRVMQRIAREAEKHPSLHRCGHSCTEVSALDDASAIANAAVNVSESLGVPVVAFTMSGSSATRISRLRPYMPLMALTPRLSTLRWLSLCYGALPCKVCEAESTDEMLSVAKETLRKAGWLDRYGKCVLVAGVPIRTEGITNLLKIHEFKS